MFSPDLSRRDPGAPGVHSDDRGGAGEPRVPMHRRAHRIMVENIGLTSVLALETSTTLSTVPLAGRQDGPAPIVTYTT